MPVVRPASIECPKWEPAAAGSKRCRYYIDPGAMQDEGLCRLPDEMLCVEWVRRNGTDAQRSALLPPPPRPERLGHGQPPAEESPPPHESEGQAPPLPRPPATLQAGDGAVLLAPQEPFRPAKEVDPQSLEALELAGVEVELAAPHLDGGITLVPARTGRGDRSEITFREAATIRLLVDAFPGCHVTAYRSKPTAAGDRRPREATRGAGDDAEWSKRLARTCPGCGAKTNTIRMPDGQLLVTPGPGPDGKCTACGAVKLLTPAEEAGVTEEEYAAEMALGTSAPGDPTLEEDPLS